MSEYDTAGPGTKDKPKPLKDGETCSHCGHTHGKDNRPPPKATEPKPPEAGIDGDKQ